MTGEQNSHTQRHDNTQIRMHKKETRPRDKRQIFQNKRNTRSTEFPAEKDAFLSDKIHVIHIFECATNEALQDQMNTRV